MDAVEGGALRGLLLLQAAQATPLSSAALTGLSETTPLLERYISAPWNSPCGITVETLALDRNAV